MVFVKFDSSSKMKCSNPLKGITYNGKDYKMFAQFDTKEQAMSWATRSKGGRAYIQTLVVEFGDYQVPGRYVVYLRKNSS